MISAFSFKGELGRRAYAAASIAIFFSQHLFAYSVLSVADVQLNALWWFWLNPLRAISAVGRPLPDWIMPAAMIMALVVDWLLVALAFRRARQANTDGGLAALSIVPFLQVPVILWLSVAPKKREPTPARPSEKGPLTAGTAVRGLLVGAGLCVAAVAVSTLILHRYGYGLFVVSPFVIGLTTAYIANRKTDVGTSQTVSIVLSALVLGGIALLTFAFEGEICLIFAAPLAFGMGIIGGLLGRALARVGRPRRGPILMNIAVLPLLLAGEVILPPKASFESTESVEVAASPAAVWDAVVHMGPIPDAPVAPFRWGLAYPMRGEILGTGVGAIRRGVFSTGVAYERVTEWTPQQKLSFVVLSDPPTMRELSPYRHVNAPHVIGYFRTLDARFTILPLANGKTRLSLATRHELDLEPALYWLPFAEWATHANKVRVLKHFRQQAEAGGDPFHQDRNPHSGA